MGVGKRSRPLLLIAASVAVALGVAIETSNRASSSAAPATVGVVGAATPTTISARTASRRSPIRSQVPRAVAASPTSTWQPVVAVAGRSTVWIARRGGVTLLRIDQRLATLHLHAGSIYPGGTGWPYGDRIAPNEIHHLIAGFNGGFKFNVPGNGFLEGSRVAVPLQFGLGSIVTYSNGTTAIGAWHEGVPSHRLSVVSVRQNLRLLVDRGALAASATSCPLSCWGATVGGRVTTARSGLGITASGDLVWAAGERLTPASLGRALIGASAVRAVQLDINPFAVAGYLYRHHPAGPTATPVVPGQNGIAGQLRIPDSRDFFTVVSR